MLNFSKDNKLTKNFYFEEFKSVVLNFILKHSKIKQFLKWHCFITLVKNKRSKTKVSRKCVFSGRSRSVYRFAKLSRIFLRKNSFINKLPGLQKSYW